MKKLKFHKAAWFGVLATLGVTLALMASLVPANAVLIGSMDRSASSVKLCLDSDCPLVDNHPFHPGRRIVVYETKGKWARVSRYIDRDKAGINYPGFFLPEKVAMWMPVTELPGPLTEQLLGMTAEEYQKLEEAKAKRRKFSYIPRKSPFPKADPRGPQGIFDLAAKPSESSQEVEKADAAQPEPSTDTDQAKEPTQIENKASDQVVVAKQEEIQAQPPDDPKNDKPGSSAVESEEEKQNEVVAGELEDAAAKVENNTDSESDNNAPPAESVTRSDVPRRSPKKSLQLASVEAPETPAEQPVEPVVEEIAIPTQMTKRLRDKRLHALPSKPGNGLDLKSIIVMRHHALAMLEGNECSSIEEGGQSFALQGWIYIKCGGDPSLHQFAVE